MVTRGGGIFNLALAPPILAHHMTSFWNVLPIPLKPRLYLSSEVTGDDRSQATRRDRAGSRIGGHGRMGANTSPNSSGRRRYADLHRARRNQNSAVTQERDQH